MSTSRYIEIFPDNTPSDGKVSFKNGFPVLSFTISAQEGLLDPQSIRIIGKLAVYSDNATPNPTPAQAGDKLTMNNRLGIYNVFDQLTIRAHRSKMICEQIRHYSKWFNTYQALTSSVNDQVSHLAESALIMPNSELFRTSVVESNGAGTKINSFSAHLPCGFCQSGNMVDLRAGAFGGVQVEINLTPDANALFFEDGTVPAGKGEAHYSLTGLKLCCEVHDIPSGTPVSPQGSYQFNTITSLYTSINSANAQIQYSLAIKNLQSAFMSFMPVSHINTLTADGQATTFPSNLDDSLAAIKRVQFLKGGVKFPAEFDYVNTYDAVNNPTQLPDPQIVKGLYDALVPAYHQVRSSISPMNMNRKYNLTTGEGSNNYNVMPLGGSVMGLGVKYGIGDAGEDFSTEQFGVSVESTLSSDNPVGVYLFFKSKATLLYSQMGTQLLV